MMKKISGPKTSRNQRVKPGEFAVQLKISETDLAGLQQVAGREAALSILPQLAQIAIDEQLGWMLGTRRLEAMSDLEIERVARMYPLLKPGEAPDFNFLFQKLKIPYSRAALILEALQTIQDRSVDAGPSGMQKKEHGLKRPSFTQPPALPKDKVSAGKIGGNGHKIQDSVLYIYIRHAISRRLETAYRFFKKILTSGMAPPITQTMTTYLLGDDLYDESFSIDTSRGEFLGEYGVGVSETIGVGEPRKVTALEVWLFDKNDIKTCTKVLMSEHAFNDPEIRAHLESRGELVMVRPGGQVLLETQTLQLLATVVDLEYGTGALPPNGFFERITLELAVWPRRWAVISRRLDWISRFFKKIKSPAVGSAGKIENTDFKKLGLAPPITQVVTTYVLGDDLYDESFSIDAKDGEFLGEYGVGTSETIGAGEPRMVTALEVWLFDKNDIKTCTRVLISEHASSDPEIRARLESKGELVVVRPGGQMLLETQTLRLLATVTDMEYGTGALPPNSYFDRITLELAIWPHGEESHQSDSKSIKKLETQVGDSGEKDDLRKQIIADFQRQMHSTVLELQRQWNVSYSEAKQRLIQFFELQISEWKRADLSEQAAATEPPAAKSGRKNTTHTLTPELRKHLRTTGQDKKAIESRRRSKRLPDFPKDLAFVLPIPIGSAASGDMITADLVRLPHLLIAGSSGSGIEHCLPSIVTSLAMNLKPDHLRLALIDSDRRNLIRFSGIPHLYREIATNARQGLAVLKGMVDEMERRYKMLETSKARDLRSYQQHRKAQDESLPYLVLVIDELGEMMTAAPDQTEHAIVRLAQMARATGIHLIVAAQHPEASILTGLIKANFPSRLAFGVASKMESSLILDGSGAEALLGNGELLFLAPDAGNPVRAQGIQLPEEEIDRILARWKKARVDPSSGSKRPVKLGGDSVEQDDLLEQAVFIVRGQKGASVSLLQRRLRIGYQRAKKLFDQLVELGIPQAAQASRQKQGPSGKAVAAHGSKRSPVLQYDVRFSGADPLFLKTFPVQVGDSLSGECGVNVCQTIREKGVVRVTALGVWLADHASHESMTQIIATEAAWNHPAHQAELQKKGKVASVEKENEWTLDLGTLRLKISIAEINFLASDEYPHAYLDSADLNLRVDIARDGRVLRPSPAKPPTIQVEQNQDMASSQDPLLDEAISLVRKEGRASVSILQRRMRIGYTRAARLVDMMEARKIIGAPKGAQQLRPVLDYGQTTPPGNDGI